MREDVPAKLKKLLGALAELREKETAVLAEIDTLLDGGVSMGVLMRRGYQAFAEAWSARYGVPYVWAFTKDGPQMKRLILSIGVDAIQARAARYVANSDGYLAKHRHPFGVFVSQVNQYAEPVVAAVEDDLEVEARKTAGRLL